jgi:peptide deformylase
MTLPITSYGHIVLRQVCRDVEPDYPGLDSLVENLADTMDAADGVGLAGPQINVPLNLFIIDTRQIYKQLNEEERARYFPGSEGVRDVFLNARIITRSADTCLYQEGCLSIPSIHEEVERSRSVEIEYRNRYFEKQTGEFTGYTARAIQHEIDHTKGILFIDHLSPLRKKMIKSKLRQVAEGKILVNYAMEFTW